MTIIYVKQKELFLGGYLGVVVFITGQTIGDALHLLPVENTLLTLPSALTANTHPPAV